MTCAAYIVAFIEPLSFVSGNGARMSIVAGAGIFSEEHPTVSSLHTVPLDEFSADTYDEAHKRAAGHLAHSHYDWCGKLRTDPIRGVYRDARTP